jgi:pimeloyl-ACP methyl ester carboxylesterase
MTAEVRVRSEPEPDLADAAAWYEEPAARSRAAVSRANPGRAPPCVQASYIGRHDEHCCVESRLGFSTGSSRAALSLLVVEILHGRSEALLALARSREPGLPIYLLGHSADGVVACTYALEHQEELAGLICESLAFQVPAPDFVISILKGAESPCASCPRAAH